MVREKKEILSTGSCDLREPLKLSRWMIYVVTLTPFLTSVREAEVEDETGVMERVSVKSHFIDTLF